MFPVLYITAVFSLVLLIVARPYEILRPSMVYCLVMVTVIGGAAAFSGADAEGASEAIWTMSVLSIMFPIGVLAWVLLTPNLSQVARRLYLRCRNEIGSPSRIRRPELRLGLVLAVLSAVSLAIYLSQIPLKSTGLAVILSGSGETRVAREESMALLSSWLARYAYSFHQTVFAPLLAVLLMLWRPRALLKRAFRIGAVCFLIASVMLVGARVPGGLVVIAICFAFLLRKGIKRGAMYTGLSAALVLLIATMLTIMREGRIAEMSVSLILEYLSGGIVRRVFVGPYNVCVWTVNYVQEHGLVGVANIRPLAILFGIEHVSLANRVALAYLPDACESNTAPAGFLVDLQASLGMKIGWVLSLVLLCSLDGALYILRPLRPVFLGVFLGVLMKCSTDFCFSGYTTCLLTHGFLLVLGLAAVFGFAYPRKRYVSRGLCSDGRDDCPR